MTTENQAARTLDDALREVRHLAFSLLREQQNALNSPRIEFWVNQIEQVSAEALESWATRETRGTAPRNDGATAEDRAQNDLRCAKYGCDDNNQLQWKWRNPDTIPERFDIQEAEAALMDAFIRQGGAHVWHGDGSSCAAQIVEAVWKKGHAAERVSQPVAPPPQTRVKLDNIRAYDKGVSPYSESECCICGKPLTEAQRRFWLLCARGDVEYAIYSIADVIDADWKPFGPHAGPNLYIVPIGSDCLKKHPECKPLAIDTKRACAPSAPAKEQE